MPDLDESLAKPDINVMKKFDEIGWDNGHGKGYALVGCNFLGGNAFFVREDLVGDHFLRPFTAENHYESPKDFLTMKNGHDRDFGEFMNHDNNLPA